MQRNIWMVTVLKCFFHDSIQKKIHCNTIATKSTRAGQNKSENMGQIGHHHISALWNTFWKMFTYREYHTKKSNPPLDVRKLIFKSCNADVSQLFQRYYGRDMHNFHVLLRLVLSNSYILFHVASNSIDYFNIISCIASFELVYLIYTLTCVNPFHGTVLFLCPLEKIWKHPLVWPKKIFLGVA